MLRLYGSPITRAQRVLWMLEELGAEYELTPVGVPSKLGDLLPKDELLKLNPSGKVPVLVDGDLVLTESYAINLHLARTRESALTPRGDAEWAKALQWTLWMATEIESDLTGVLVPRRAGLLAQFDEAQKKHDALLRFGLHHRLGTLETGLADRDWLVGARFTVADLNLASMLALAAPSGVSFDARPRVDAWLAACLARPAARRAWGLVLDDAKAFSFVGDLAVRG